MAASLIFFRVSSEMNRFDNFILDIVSADSRFPVLAMDIFTLVSGDWCFPVCEVDNFLRVVADTFLPNFGCILPINRPRNESDIFLRVSDENCPRLPPSRMLYPTLMEFRCCIHAISFASSMHCGVSVSHISIILKTNLHRPYFFRA